MSPPRGSESRKTVRVSGSQVSAARGRIITDHRLGLATPGWVYKVAAANGDRRWLPGGSELARISKLPRVRRDSEVLRPRWHPWWRFGSAVRPRAQHGPVPPPPARISGDEMRASGLARKRADLGKRSWRGSCRRTDAGASLGPVEASGGTSYQVPTRVDLPAGGRATLGLPGMDPIDLSADLLSALLVSGLRAGPAADVDQSGGLGTLTVDAGAVWYVGATPIDVDFAVQVAARGVEEVLHEAIRYAAPRSAPPEVPTAASHEGGRPKAARAASSAPGCRSVPVEVAEEDLEVLVEQAAAGATITLTRAEEVVAVIVPWARYRRLRLALAELDLAHWSAWTDSRFDDGRFASLARNVLPLEPESFGRSG